MKKSNRNSFIFSYFDGEKERRIDAFNMALRLQEKFGMSLTLTETITTKDITAVRELFELKSYDEETGLGVTDGELLEILTSFNDLIEKKSKPLEQKQTSPQSTVLPSLHSQGLPKQVCG